MDIGPDASFAHLDKHLIGRCRNAKILCGTAQAGRIVQRTEHSDRTVLAAECLEALEAAYGIMEGAHKRVVTQRETSIFLYFRPFAVSIAADYHSVGARDVES